ncbi:pyridoxine 5'-phosphate synthase [Desulforegula conservatrix]|uniref:pyridoxine 5'-phosphate synthase n=1 Tax=Desulforegula conservatrix TaxID=153026 RepID=UPI00040307A5|nr:pyridoxine 5'-phosphate synthase [Desulforegula conservatrix]
MASLAVNVDHVATLREARKINYPDPVIAAAAAELAGADGVVVHLREDRRHIQDRDVYLLRQTVQTKLILEMAATDEMTKIALEIIPDLVTLVPEKRQEITTEGGLDIINNRDRIAETIDTLKQAGVPVSLFLNPSLKHVELAKSLGADKIEIHTGIFCEAESPMQQSAAMSDIIDAAKLAKEMGLGVNAGHGICYKNIKAFKGIKEIDEFSIGHSIVSRSIMVGMENAVREMIRLIESL